MKKAILSYAESMDSQTLSVLQNGIKEKFGNDINIVSTPDNSLIGGFILSVDGRIYDNSISSQLKNIKRELCNE